MYWEQMEQVIYDQICALYLFTIIMLGVLIQLHWLPFSWESEALSLALLI